MSGQTNSASHKLWDGRSSKKCSAFQSSPHRIGSGVRSNGKSSSPWVSFGGAAACGSLRLGWSRAVWKNLWGTRPGELTFCYGKLPFIVDFPIKKWWFSIAMLVHQRVQYVLRVCKALQLICAERHICSGDVEAKNPLEAECGPSDRYHRHPRCKSGVWLRFTARFRLAPIVCLSGKKPRNSALRLLRPCLQDSLDLPRKLEVKKTQWMSSQKIKSPKLVLRVTVSYAMPRCARKMFHCLLTALRAIIENQHLLKPRSAKELKSLVHRCSKMQTLSWQTYGWQAICKTDVLKLLPQFCQHNLELRSAEALPEPKRDGCRWRSARWPEMTSCRTWLKDALIQLHPRRPQTVFPYPLQRLRACLWLY